MAVTKENIIHDVIFFIKDDLDGQVTDPISSTRSAKSSFIMTSYPVKEAQYPLITIKITNFTAIRAGMQTTAQDITLPFEIRVWARNEIEKDRIAQQILSRLADIQFTVDGSTDSNLHDLTITSAVEIDEPGEIGGKGGIKSRVISGFYRFYNIS